MTETILAFIPSPSQGVWHIGPVPIRAYALCIIAGIVAALIIGDRRWVARGGEQGVIYDIALLAVPFGLVGGRLYHVMTDWKTYFGDGGAGLGAAFRIWDGGLGIWGAVALGAVGAWIGCRMRGIPLPAFGDAIAPGIILAQAIGRLGNYFNQELYGRETTVPWGLEIYERRDASGALNTLNGVSDGQLVGVVHPTFLYELFWNLLIFALLLWLDKRFNMGHGRLFALYVAGYCVGRFWIELMRSDPASMPVDGIRVNTFTSTFVFIAAVVYIMVAPKGREDPEKLRGKQDDASPVDDRLAKELATVGAGTGVVAAATVAGAAEAEDAVAVGDVEDDDADVVEEAEAADEAEEPVDADTLEVADEESAEVASDAEPESSDVSSELEKAAESLAADSEAAEQEPAEGETADEAEADVPADGGDDDEPEGEAAAEAETAEGDSAEGDATEDEPAEGESAEAAAAEAPADGAEPEGEGEPAEEAVAAEEPAEESESPAEPAADAAVVDEATAEAETEAAEGDSVEVDAVESEPADGETAAEAEAPANSDEAEAETAEGDSTEGDAAEDESGEAEAPADSDEPDEEPADGESAEEAEAPTADGEPNAAPEAEVEPSPKPEPAATPAPPSRKPRWWRRNS